MSEMIHVDSIKEIHKRLEYGKPLHPLITLIDISEVQALENYRDIKLKLGFYTVGLKTGKDCEIKYGRRSYDFDDGSLVFSAPDQVVTIDFDPTAENMTGWMLCIHPDLLSGFEVGKNMENYRFFSYSSNEALHLSEKEMDTITSIVNTIKDEYSMNLDQYSQKLIVSNIEVLLNYCERFYGRQFITRKKVNTDVVSTFEDFLNKRLAEDQLEANGIPQVIEIAEEMGYSKYYLSDLLKKETGSSIQEHIHEKLIQRAKNMLIGSEEGVAEIAYHLGYEYPEHFSKFFKKKTGTSPNKYRKSFKVV